MFADSTWRQPVQMAQSLMVDEYRTGSGSDQIPYSTSKHYCINELECGIRSLPLPVPYLSTHNEAFHTNKSTRVNIPAPHQINLR